MRAAILTAGCRLNQAETEQLAQGFLQAGHRIARDRDDADVVVVNTCSVTVAAGAKSRRAAGAARPGQRRGPGRGLTRHRSLHQL